MDAPTIKALSLYEDVEALAWIALRLPAPVLLAAE